MNREELKAIARTDFNRNLDNANFWSKDLDGAQLTADWGAHAHRHLINSGAVNPETSNFWEKLHGK